MKISLEIVYHGVSPFCYGHLSQVVTSNCSLMLKSLKLVSLWSIYSIPYNDKAKTYCFKLCQVGWGTMVDSHFQVFSWVQVRALAVQLKEINRIVSKQLLHCLGFVLRVTESEPSRWIIGVPSNTSWVLRTRVKLEILFVTVWESFRCFFCKPQAGSHVSLPRRDSLLATLP